VGKNLRGRGFHSNTGYETEEVRKKKRTTEERREDLFVRQGGDLSSGWGGNQPHICTLFRRFEGNLLQGHKRKKGAMGLTKREMMGAAENKRPGNSTRTFLKL